MTRVYTDWDVVIGMSVERGAIPGDPDLAPDLAQLEETVREILAYYHEQTDEPGEIMLPMDPPGSSPEYSDICRELGVTWVFERGLRDTKYRSNPELVMDYIGESPPE